MLMINLTMPSELKTVMHLLAHPMLVFVHFEPPSETCSRARELPLPDGRPGPPPLRSPDFPAGLSDLHVRLPHEVPRVEAANKLYQFLAETAAALIDRGILWSIAHPRDSLLWYFPAVRSLTDRLDTSFVHFQHCAYGGERPKWTGVLHFPGGALDALRAVCPGVSSTHCHAAWGRTGAGSFATALETVYPMALCERIASTVLDFLKIAPQKPLPVIRARGGPVERRHRPTLQAAARQPRGSRARQLLPEFISFITVRAAMSASDPRCRPGHKWCSTTLQGKSIPDGAKTVRAFFGGVSGAMYQSLASSLPPLTSSQSFTSSPPASSPPTSLASPPPSLIATPASKLPTRGCISAISDLLEDDVYIGREHRGRGGRFLAASRWANPFKLKDCVSRKECVDRYDAHLRASPDLVAALPDLLGKRLVCHCAPHLECHADVIIKAIAELVLETSDLDVTLLVGIPADPASFALSALRLRHPFEDHAGVPSVIDGLRFRMTSSVVAITEHRVRMLHHWRRRAAALEPQEAVLHARMHPNVREVMKGKRLLLFKEMLVAAEMPKVNDLIHFLTTGFPLAGVLPRTGIFPEADRAAMMSVDDLYVMRDAIRADILASCRSSGDAELDVQLYEATEEEVKKGWLVGPLCAGELDQLGLWIPSRRFPVVQGSKLRPVDDYSASHINATVAMCESIDPADVDAIVANARLHADALVADPTARHPSSPFTGLQRHQDHDGDVLLGRLWDITSAYKHLAVRPSHAHLAIVAVFNPRTGAADLFRQPALPFGATAAVLCFNWVAYGIGLVLTSLFKLGSTNFYDDYTILETRRLAGSAGQTVEAVFDLLGWSLKALPDFSPTPQPLGARLDLSMANSGTITIGNRPERTAELVKNIDEAVTSSTADRKALERLRGRILFSRSLCFGRFAALALHQLNVACSCLSASSTRSAVRPLSDDLKAALRALSAAVAGSPMRIVRVAYHYPLVLFTDGAFEGTEGAFSGTLGGVLFDPGAGDVLFFATVLSAETMALLTACSANPICVIELLGVLLALWLWRGRLHQRPLLGFIDNEPAKHAMCRGGSSSVDAAAVVNGICNAEITDRILAYWDRVPSASNIADAPSRGARPAQVPGWPEPVRSLVAHMLPAAGDRAATAAAPVTGCSTAGSEWLRACSLLLRGVRDIALKP